MFIWMLKMLLLISIFALWGAFLDLSFSYVRAQAALRNVTVVSDPASRAAASLCDPFGGSSYYEETIDFARRVRVLRFNSCPNHFNQCQNSECAGNATYAVLQWKTLEIPLYPGLAMPEDVQSVRCSTDPNDIVAVALNGVPFRSNSDAFDIGAVCVSPRDYLPQNGISSGCDLNGIGDGSKYCGDHVARSAAHLDKCGGHADSRDGLYHYNVPPSCLLHRLPPLPDSGGHSPQLGWALDGFPVYGPRGPNGLSMRPCPRGDSNLDSKFCLDDCNGFYGELPGVDAYLYRYYISGDIASTECSSTIALDVDVTVQCGRREDSCCPSVVPSSKLFAPFTPACFRGCPASLSGDSRTCRYRDDIRSTTESFFPELSNFGSLAFKSPQVDDYASPTSSPTSPPLTSAPTRVPQPETRILPLLPSMVLYRSLDPYRSLVLQTGDRSEIRESTFDMRLSSNVVGLAVDSSGSVYYSTQRDIRVISKSPTGIFSLPKTLVWGMTDLVIHGSDFGDSPCRVQVRDADCTSVRLAGPGAISCRTVARILEVPVEPASVLRGSEVNEGIDAADVVVSCSTGAFRGVHLQPETVSRSRARRLVVSRIDIQRTNILPYAVAISTSRNGAAGALFWSDIGRDARRIYRSLLDASEPRVVLSNVNEVYSLYHVPRCAAPGLRSAGGCGPDPLSTSSSSALAALNALGANDHDALFYVDADRGYISGQNGQTQVQRWGVVGLVFIDSLDQAGAAAVFDGATSSLRAAVPQTRDGVEVSLFEAQPEPGRDVVLLDGLVDPRGVTFDTATGYLFVATLDGTLVRIDVMGALTDYYRQGLTNCTSLGAGEGSPSEYLFEKCLRPVYSVHKYMEELGSDRSIAGRRRLDAIRPPWLAIIRAVPPNSRSRFAHAALVPSSYFVSPGGEGVDVDALRRRRDRKLILVDTALNRIYFTDAFGARRVHLDVLVASGSFGERHRAFWPVAAQVERALDASDVVSIYVSEYFGAIWRLEVNCSALVDAGIGAGVAVQVAGRDSQPVRQLRLLSVPVLVTPAEAGSPEAQRLRDLLAPSAHLAQQMQSHAQPPHQPIPGSFEAKDRKPYVFFEALN